MEYSEDDKIVLNFFFTNLDKPIFAVKNMHPEVWALMQARYSRTREGVRESFIKLLKEEPENFQKLKEEIEKTEGGVNSQHAINKAIQFMEKWVLGFGHSSVSEGAVVGFSLEGVSILATKVIEDNRLSSFIEKSTRYVSFDNSSFFIDEDLKNSEFYPEIQEYLDFLFKVYLELHNPVLDYVKTISPKNEDTPIPAWERACAARRFDAIRYLLPTCTKTSLGWTVNARQLSHGISKLLSHPLKEMNYIGESLKEEGKKVLPSLLKYANKSDYFINTNNDMNELSKAFEIENSNIDPVVLVNGPEDADNRVIAAILYKYKQESYSRILERVRLITRESKEKILDTFLKHRGKFDSPLREFEHANFTFDIVMDYGAFRDLQRHRICTQTNQLFTNNLSYDTPEDIINAGVQEKYTQVMEKANQLYEKLKDRYPQQAQYLLPLGYRKRFLISFNLREAYYLIKLRTTPMAHASYRRIGLKMYNILKNNYPLLIKYLELETVHEELGRLKSEERTEKRTSLV
ncbi:MAG: FAD-dependent thymidylate synthase [archaeon]